MSYSDACVDGNGTQLVGKLFETPCAFLVTKHLTNIAYRLGANVLVQGFNTMITSRLQRYVPEHQGDWDIYVWKPTYAYNSRAPWFRGLTHFSMVLPQNLLGLTTLDALTVLLTKGTTTTSHCILPVRLQHFVATRWQDGHKRMKTAQRSFKGDHDKKIRNASNTLDARQQVYTDIPSIKSSAAERMAND